LQSCGSVSARTVLDCTQMIGIQNLLVLLDILTSGVADEARTDHQDGLRRYSHSVDNRRCSAADCRMINSQAGRCTVGLLFGLGFRYCVPKSDSSKSRKSCIAVVA